MAWYESKKGWSFGAAGGIYLILDHYGYLASLVDIYRFIKTHWPKWSTISPFIAPAFFVLALVFFEFDRRSGKHVDPRTLKGKALKVRDEMQAFLNSLGEPSKEALNDETDIQYITRVSADTGRRWNLLGHHYELNCATEVARIFHEFGMRGVQEYGLESENSSRKKEEEYKTIIDSLTRVAETPEAKAKI